jgi:colicin import membrane protein
MAPPASIQVKLIGVPQPTMPSKPEKPPEEIRTQDSAAPKEPPLEMKNIPDSQAKTKFVTENKPVMPDKPNPIEAQKRPPVLDKNPLKKKVVKNDLSAKVVKNPEDFLKALDFVDKLEQKQTTAPQPVAATENPAGDGPELQINLADSGAVSAIQGAINKNWFILPGMDTRNLTVTVQISLASNGQLSSIHISHPSGNPSFDESLLRAVRKSIPLPIPPDKFEKFREMELSFQAPVH